jgi:hypothetical protein
MTNQAIESATNALAQFSLAAPEVGEAHAISSAPAPVGADIVARTTMVDVAFVDSAYSFARIKPGHDAGEDRGPNVARNVVSGGAPALDTRLDDRTIPPRQDDDSGRRRRPAEPDVADPPGDAELSNADACYALDDIVRFDGKIIASHRDDMRDEQWPLSAHS